MRENAGGGEGNGTTGEILEANGIAHQGNLKADIMLFESKFKPEHARFEHLYTVSLQEAKALHKGKDADIIDVLNAKATCRAEGWDILYEMDGHWDAMLPALKPGGWRPDTLAASREAFLEAFRELATVEAEERKGRERRLTSQSVRFYHQSHCRD